MSLPPRLAYGPTVLPKLSPPHLSVVSLRLGRVWPRPGRQTPAPMTGVHAKQSASGLYSRCQAGLSLSKNLSPHDSLSSKAPRGRWWKGGTRIQPSAPTLDLSLPLKPPAFVSRCRSCSKFGMVPSCGKSPLHKLPC